MGFPWSSGEWASSIVTEARLNDLEGQSRQNTGSWGCRKQLRHPVWGLPWFQQMALWFFLPGGCAEQGNGATQLLCPSSLSPHCEHCFSGMLSTMSV